MWPLVTCHAAVETLKEESSSKDEETASVCATVKPAGPTATPAPPAATPVASKRLKFRLHVSAKVALCGMTVMAMSCKRPVAAAWK